MILETVTSDAGPLHYLVLIDAIQILPSLFDKVLVAPQVRDELIHPHAPARVRAWIEGPPPWLMVTPNVTPIVDRGVHVGECAAIAIAAQSRIRLLIDDQAGRATAQKYGVEVFGTLGILQRAAEKKLVNLSDAIDNLRATNFYISHKLLSRALQTPK